MDTQGALAFHEVAEDTRRKLTNLWDEIGSTAEERAEIHRRLNADVVHLYHNVVKAEQANKEALTQNILRMVDDLLGVCASLGEELHLEDAVGALPLRQRLAAIRSQLEACEARKADRLAVLSGLQKRLNELCDELGVEPPEALEELGNDLSQDRVKEYNAEITRLINEKTSRMNQVKELVVQILGLWEELCMPPETEFDKAILKGDVPPTPTSIQRLQEKKEKLIEDKNFREDIVKGYAKKITVLWEQLSVKEAERESFFNRHTGLGPSVLDAVRAELKRLEDIKAASMKQLICDARSQIVQLWNELHLSEEERRRFSAAYTSDYTDEILQLHQDEIDRLEVKLKEYKPIIQLIGRREAIKHERAELEASAADPSRLLTKSRDQAGRLLREEKLRRMVAKDLPRIEAQLKQTLVEWEGMYGQEFLYNGRRYLQVMADDEDGEKRKKEAEKSRREREKAVRMGLVGPSTGRENALPSKTPSKTMAAAKSTIASRTRTPLTPGLHHNIRPAVSASAAKHLPAVSPSVSTPDGEDVVKNLQY